MLLFFRPEFCVLASSLVVKLYDSFLMNGSLMQGQLIKLDYQSRVLTPISSL